MNREVYPVEPVGAGCEHRCRALRFCLFRGVEDYAISGPQKTPSYQAPPRPGPGTNPLQNWRGSGAALMLVQRLGLEVLLSIRTDNESGDLSAAMVRVGLIPFIKCDDQQAACLKCGTGDQWRDVRLQPDIGLGETAIVGVVHEVGHDERILR